MEKVTLMCPCLFGLESVLSFEVKKLGGENIVVTDGRVTFDGDLSMVAKANIWLRTAERVGIVIGSFRAETFTELFDQTAELPWEQFIGEDDCFPVKGWSVNSKLFSMSDCQRIIKRAVVRRFENVYHKTLFAETGALYQIQYSIHKDQVTLVLDTSGPGLHKRGYRANANDAPIKETLAAGIVDLARVRGDSLVFDPMCGSGTLVIESALRALNIAPGIRRRFAAQGWRCFQNGLFDEARRDAASQVRRDAPFEAFASDIDPEAVRLTRENAAKAGGFMSYRPMSRILRRSSLRDEAVLYWLTRRMESVCSANRRRRRCLVRLALPFRSVTASAITSSARMTALRICLGVLPRAAASCITV